MHPIETADAPRPVGHYSQGIATAYHIYVSGQGAADPTTGKMADTIAAQTRQAIANVQSILAASGATLADVVKLTVHLADLDEFAEYDAALGDILGAHRPARTTVGSQLMGTRIEIDAIAVRAAAR